ncbi:tyrosine-type recombinase/integrase [Phyllobacterium sp. BT25]|uniref:Tyrosine-type recombinase/integrase n=1 Tax=Phyllobacterium pellucidum TaxID=2740464 RepID=A0A849VVV4_9HYPH|nr:MULTISPECIES: tyrosine-type recombinase/integrase [Phyllobacterium]NTS33886.1 tyrosine-type recombinase/integrase [Phyllobacterium pellucidum]SFJ16603.1 Site-specific recombinase XerD [Phyllobacterium sp. CL33Tsu]
MAEKARKITQPAIDRGDYKPKLGADGKPKLTYYPDAGKPGLVLVVQPSGKKSWVIFYRRLSDRKQRKYTLEGFPSLGAAHKLAQDKLDDISNGLDPAAQKQEAKRAAKEGTPDRDLFKTVVERYMRVYRQGRATQRKKKKDYKPKERTVLETARLLGLKPDPENPNGWAVIEGGLVEKWGDRRIQDIRKRDVRDHLDGLLEKSERKANGAPYVANRTYAALAPLFAWAAQQDDDLMIEAAQLKWNKAAEQKRERFLNQDEIRWFWQATGEKPDGIGWPFGSLFRLLLLTGARKSQVGEATDSELDLSKRLWTIPDREGGKGKVNKLPLTDEVLAILKGLKRVKDTKLLFTMRGDKLNPTSYRKAYLRCRDLMEQQARKEAAERGDDPQAVSIEHWSVHALRHTVETHMRDDELRIGREQVNAVLNHSEGGMSGVYNHAEGIEMKREALEKWERYVLRLVNGNPPAENVVPLPLRARE